jgi:asparagine synthase (glutamine-hydrolysing)
VPPCRTPDEVLSALDRALADRLESDVPLGCFLSGGIDSPLVAAAAARRVPGLRTFTVRMPDPRYDESARAERIAAHLGTRHTTLDADAHPRADLERLIPQLGLPLGDSSLLPTHWVSRAARSHVTVALSGDGADELFDGYARYRAAGWLRSFGGLLALGSGLAGPLARGAHPKSARSFAARLVAAAKGWGYDDLLAVFPAGAWARLTGPGTPGPALDAAGSADPGRRDFLTSLPGDLLRKVDTASMAVALEVRAPFLAREIIEARLADPAPDHRGAKALLRAAAARVLPAGVAAAPKSGFAVPIGDWLRGPLGGFVREVALDPSAFEPFAGVLPVRPGSAEAFVSEHQSGAVDHSQRVYHLAVLALWGRWLAGQRVAR